MIRSLKSHYGSSAILHMLNSFPFCYTFVTRFKAEQESYLKRVENITATEHSLHKDAEKK